MSMVQQAGTAEEKNSTLCNLTYDLLKVQFGVKLPPRAQRRMQQKIKQHDRALKEVTKRKNAARQALKRAKKEGAGAERPRVQAQAEEFLSLLRDHSRLKKASIRRSVSNEAKVAREQCHKYFWQYVKDLFDENCTPQTFPQFSAESAHAFFSEAYKSSVHQFEAPSCLPTPPPPQEQMCVSPITFDELVGSIQRSSPSLTPSQHDQIPYLVFKRCPSLAIDLLDLFNCVLAQGKVPSGWKTAAVKLIGKGSAHNDPTVPGNFRPVALTPTVSKLFSCILKDRWLRHMTTNGYLSSDIQKAFLPTIPGVTKHQFKLANIINVARGSKRWVAVAWLDIANAYDSVHHSLNQMVLAQYHAPPEFCHQLQSWYTGLSVSISTHKWETPSISFQKGMYQGDPLSVAIFVTVMNTLSDTLRTREDLGFFLPN